MIRILTGVALLALGMSARADGTKAEEELDTITMDFSKAMKAFEKELDAAKTDAERKDIEAKNPAPKFAEQFLSLARKYRKEKAAFEALVAAMGASGGPQNKDGCWPNVIKALERDHTERPDIRKIVRELSGSGDEASMSLLKAIQEKNPDKKIQARACKGLRDIHRELADFAARLRKDGTLRKNVEKVRGKETIEKLLTDAETSEKLAAELTKEMEGKYAGLVFDTSIGKLAPDTALEDLQGKKVKLSDLRGKVVVVDFWATWCGPCRAMIPHTRKLTAKHKDKPFVFVSISADDDKKTVLTFMEKNPLPWTHWFNGPEGGAIDDWDIEGFPTVFVLDAKGVIREKDVQEEDLDKAVEKLLKETEIGNIAMDRLDSEQAFHDMQARDRAATFERDPGRLVFRDSDYLDHETWIRPAFEAMGDVSGLRVLDFGCGHGMASVVLARRGARVTAFDLSPGYVGEAQRRAAANSVSVEFLVADGQRLPLADESFDRIWGNAVLHHLDLKQAGSELRRVLRPGGVAVFCEPWGGNPLLSFARRHLPYPAKERTPDEEPLCPRGLAMLRKVFPTIEVRGYQLLSMLRRVLPWSGLTRCLEQCDGWLLKHWPALQRFCRYLVIILRCER